MNDTIFASEFNKPAVITWKYSICTITVANYNIRTAIIAIFNIKSVFSLEYNITP
jgi:hypothetical protein